MNKEKMEELASKAAKKALAGRPKYDENVEDDDSGIDFSISESSTIEDIAEFDLFDFCENEFVKKGDFVEYTIKKNGATIGFKKHPYSWEKIQKEFGGGRYNVLAKSILTGRIVKRQSMPVEDLATEEKRENGYGFNPSDLVAQIADAVKPRNEGPNFMELFAMMNSQQEKSRIEADRAAEKARQDADKQSSNLIQIMQQNTLMMLEMMKGTKKDDSTVQIAQLIQAFADKMESRFERTIDKLQNQNANKGSEMGLLEVLKLQQDAQDKGFKLYSQLNSIAEAKAEEKMEMLEEYRETKSGGNGEKKSMTDTLIETMLPTIAGALAKQGQPAPQAVRPAQPQQRRAVRPNAASANPIGQRVPTNQAQANPQAANKAPQAASQGSRTIGGPNVGQSPKPSKNSVGLPKATFRTAKPVEEFKVRETPVNTSVQYKERLSGVLIPIFTQHLLEQSEPVVAAGAIEATLLDNGVTTDEFLAKISLDDIMEIVQGFELPQEANPWFEEVYANIKTKPDLGVGEYALNAGI